MTNRKSKIVNTIVNRQSVIIVNNSKSSNRKLFNEDYLIIKNNL